MKTDDLGAFRRGVALAATTCLLSMPSPSPAVKRPVVAWNEVEVIRAAIALSRPEGSFCVQEGVGEAALSQLAARLGEKSEELGRRMTREERNLVIGQMTQAWMKPRRDDAAAPVAPVESEDARALATALARLLDKPRKRLVRKVRAEWLPAGGRLVARPTDCRVAIALSSPVVDGDIGFVDIASWCGPLCGSGRIYAFRRVPEGWKVIGYQQSWVS